MVLKTAENYICLDHDPKVGLILLSLSFGVPLDIFHCIRFQIFRPDYHKDFFWIVAPKFLKNEL